ncbi:lipid II flippase MurJ, partial [Leifsonia sp. SIMBA_070]|uniref:lipid II flippase MurJ n=1 Tax=Leifsonia sp. SIMBA_070 TaxID=3085810 RepID=UPI00397DB908
PQIFFYGAFALVGETMNARRVFGPYMWAPATNNIVSIAGFLIIGAIFRGDLTESSAWSPGMAATLGITATLSVALQAVTLAFFWRKTGLRIRPDFRWRGAGLG